MREEAPAVLGWERACRDLPVAGRSPSLRRLTRARRGVNGALSNCAFPKPSKFRQLRKVDRHAPGLVAGELRDLINIRSMPMPSGRLLAGSLYLVLPPCRCLCTAAPKPDTAFRALLPKIPRKTSTSTSR